MEIIRIISLVLSIISVFFGVYFLGKYKGKEEALKRLEELCSSINKINQ